MDEPESQQLLQRVTELVAVCLVGVAGLGAIALLSLGVWAVLKLVARI